MATFLAMGGYASFVWSAYGITAIVLLANLIFAVHAKRTQLQRIRQRQREA